MLYSFYTVLPIFYFTMLPIAQFSAAKVWLWIIIKKCVCVCMCVWGWGWIVIYNPTTNPINKTGRKPMFSKCIHILQKQPQIVNEQGNAEFEPQKKKKKKKKKLKGVKLYFVVKKIFPITRRTSIHVGTWTSLTTCTWWCVWILLYEWENTPIQIYRKFHFQKLIIFR